MGMRGIGYLPHLTRNSSIVEEEVKRLFPDDLPPNPRQTGLCSGILLDIRDARLAAACFLTQPRVDVVFGRDDPLARRDRIEDQHGADRVRRRRTRPIALLCP